MYILNVLIKTETNYPGRIYEYPGRTGSFYVPRIEKDSACGLFILLMEIEDKLKCKLI